MYLKHFNLTDRPFAITPDPRFLYLSARHREALAHLLYGLGEGGGFVQLTGEVGTGKTTICRCLLEHIPDNVDLALVLNPKVTAHELIATVCDELGIDYPPENSSIKKLTDVLPQSARALRFDLRFEKEDGGEIWRVVSADWRDAGNVRDYLE